MLALIWKLIGQHLIGIHAFHKQACCISLVMLAWGYFVQGTRILMTHQHVHKSYPLLPVESSG